MNFFLEIGKPLRTNYGFLYSVHYSMDTIQVQNVLIYLLAEIELVAPGIVRLSIFLMFIYYFYLTANKQHFTLRPKYCT